MNALSIGTLLTLAHAAEWMADAKDSFGPPRAMTPSVIRRYDRGAAYLAQAARDAREAARAAGASAPRAVRRPAQPRDPARGAARGRQPQRTRPPTARCRMTEWIVAIGLSLLVSSIALVPAYLQTPNTRKDRR